MTRPEDALHEAVASLLTRIIAPAGQASAEGAMWVTIEHRCRLSAGEAANRQRRGVVAGVPDLLVIWRGQVLGIELKAGKGASSRAQEAFHAAMVACGSGAVLCRRIDQVVSALVAWGVPHRRVS